MVSVGFILHLSSLSRNIEENLKGKNTQNGVVCVENYNWKNGPQSKEMSGKCNFIIIKLCLELSVLLQRISNIFAVGSF